MAISADNSEMVAALVGLGTNLGDRTANLDSAVHQLRGLASVGSFAVSSWHETVAVGGDPAQPCFLNGVALLETSLEPLALLAALHAIEQSLGRKRNRRWAARTLDLDLLLYGDLVLATRDLRVPHLRMAWRRFVLAPAAEVAPEFVHPEIGWTISQLLRHWNEAVPYVACCGPAASRVTAWLGQKWNAPLLFWKRVQSQPAYGLDRGRWELLREPLVSDFWCGEPHIASRPTMAGGNECIRPKVIVVCGNRQDAPPFSRCMLANWGPVLQIDWPDDEVEIPPEVARELLALGECLK